MDLNIVAGAHRGRPDRRSSAPTAAARSTRPNNLDKVAIIDLRGPDPGAFHDVYRTYAMRARLLRNFGTAANQVLWRGQVPLIGDANYADEAMFAVDRWLARVARRPPRRPAGAEDHPGQARRRRRPLHRRRRQGRCRQRSATRRSRPTARRASGADGRMTDDDLKCQLQAAAPRRLPGDLHRRPVGAAAARRSRAASATTRKPGVSQHGAVPWLTYQTRRGRVIYGGKRLGRPPRSHRIR